MNIITDAGQITPKDLSQGLRAIGFTTTWKWVRIELEGQKILILHIHLGQYFLYFEDGQKREYLASCKPETERDIALAVHFFIRNRKRPPHLFFGNTVEPGWVPSAKSDEIRPGKTPAGAAKRDPRPVFWRRGAIGDQWRY